MKKQPKVPRPITGQVVYMGPQMPQLGLGYGQIFRNKKEPNQSCIHSHLYEAIAACPSLGELFVPVRFVSAVRRELNFDIAHKMRGQTGRYVTFYRDAEQWRTTQTQHKPKTIETHHA
jgi:hypothetical protein